MYLKTRLDFWASCLVLFYRNHVVLVILMSSDCGYILCSLKMNVNTWLNLPNLTCISQRLLIARLVRVKTAGMQISACLVLHFLGLQVKKILFIEVVLNSWYKLLLCRVRTSSGMFLRRGQDKIIRNIEKRIADFTFIPVGMWSGQPSF